MEKSEIAEPAPQAVALDSISTTVAGLMKGEEEAVEKVFARYFDALVRKAKRRLGQGMERAGDAEDIALEALRQFFAKARQNGFAKLRKNDDIRTLLLVLVDRRTLDFKRSAQRRRRVEVGESVVANRGDDPAPFDLEDFRPPKDFVVSFGCEVQELLGSIGDRGLAEIAVMRLEGWTNAEIARSLNLSERSVERKLERIRTRLLQRA